MLYNSIIGKKGWRDMKKTNKKKMEDGYKSIEELDMYMLYYGDAVVYQGGSRDLVKTVIKGAIGTFREQVAPLIRMMVYVAVDIL